MSEQTTEPATRRFEITWTTGHTEVIEAEQVVFAATKSAFSRLGDGAFGETNVDPVIKFHGTVDGSWTLILWVRESDIRTIRNVTRPESAPGGAA